MYISMTSLLGHRELFFQQNMYRFLLESTKILPKTNFFKIEVMKKCWTKGRNHNHVSITSNPAIRFFVIITHFLPLMLPTSLSNRISTLSLLSAHYNGTLVCTLDHTHHLLFCFVLSAADGKVFLYESDL